MTALFVSLMSIMSRFWYVRHNYNPKRLATDSMMLFGVSLLGFFIYYEITVGYTWIELIYGAVGSAISCFANIILTDAIVRGLGGPAGALA